MARSSTRPPAPKERPVALAVTGSPTLVPRPERLPLTPRFEGPPQTRVADAGRGDMIGFVVFLTLIVLGLIAAARAFMVM